VDPGSDQAEEAVKERKRSVDDPANKAAEQDWMANFVDDYKTQVRNRGRQQGETVGETVGETGGGPEDEQMANDKLAGVSKSFATVARELGINSRNQQACSPECQHESSW